jgi:hypothetical protein
MPYGPGQSLKIAPDNFYSSQYEIRHQTKGNESGSNASFCAGSVSDIYGQNGLCTPVDFAVKTCSESLRYLHEPLHTWDNQQTKRLRLHIGSEVGYELSDFGKEPGSAFSSMCSSASTVASSTFTSELPSSIDTVDSAQPFLPLAPSAHPFHQIPTNPRPFQQQLNLPPHSTPVHAGVASAAKPFTLACLLPPGSTAASAASAHARRFPRPLPFEAASAAAISAPQLRAASGPSHEPLEWRAGTDSEARAAAAAYVAVAAAEYAASERLASTGRKRPAGAADDGAGAAGPGAAEELGLGPGRPFSRLPPVVAAAAAFAAAASYLESRGGRDR